MSLRLRAVFAAAAMVLCGLALPVAMADGNEPVAVACACGMGGFAVVAARRWWQAARRIHR